MSPTDGDTPAALYASKVLSMNSVVVFTNSGSFHYLIKNFIFLQNLSSQMLTNHQDTKSISDSLVFNSILAAVCVMSVQTSPVRIMSSPPGTTLVFPTITVLRGALSPWKFSIIIFLPSTFTVTHQS